MVRDVGADRPADDGGQGPRQENEVDALHRTVGREGAGPLREQLVLVVLLHVVEELGDRVPPEGRAGIEIPADHRPVQEGVAGIDELVVKESDEPLHLGEPA